MSLETVFADFMTALLPTFILTIISIVSFSAFFPKAYKNTIGKWDEKAWYRVIGVFLVNMIIVIAVFNLFPSFKDLMPIKF